MSFFKKLTDEFKDFKLGDSKDKQQEQPPQPSYDATRGYGDQNYGAPSYQQNPQYQQQSYPPPQQYGQPPPQQYNSPPPQQQYNQPPPQQYGQPYGGQQQQYPANGPAPQPPRWIQQFDQASQRTYYVETTGRSEWDIPNDGGQRSVGGAGGFYDQYGGAMPPQAPSQPAYQHEQNAQQYYGDVQKKEKNHDTRNMLLGGAAGLAVGGLAVAALSGDDSDDEKRAAPIADPGYGAPPGGHDSDAESLREAQANYNEAAAAAADSDASSSEQEELQEAREEYEEEREEYYDD